MPLSTKGVLRWLQDCAAVVERHRDELNALDAAIGDADHGANLDRGFKAVVAVLPSLADQDVGAIFKRVGMTLVSTVGGASGPLYGTFFLKLGTALAGKSTLSLEDWTTALHAAVSGVAARGHASLGDKTMLDALLPAVEPLDEALAAGMDLSAALARSADAAEAGATATTALIARKGRASYLGERSAGHQDPGATSAALILRALASTG